MSLRLSNLLADQYNLQVEHFGVDFESLSVNPELRAEWLHLNATGLMSEAAEVAACVGWKPWADDRGWIDKHRLTEEVCDLLAFAMNLLNLADVTADELSQTWRRTVLKNTYRQENGYTSQKEQIIR